MPYTSAWVDPEVFLEHQGVIVFHTYKDNDVADQKLTYWYTTSSISDEESFDVRSLDVPSAHVLRQMQSSTLVETRDGQPVQAEPVSLEQAIATVVKEAIELGLVTAPDDEHEQE